MKFIKNNKYTIIAIIIFMCLVILGVQVKNLLVPDSGKAVYGDRLDGMDEYKLSTTFFDTLISKIKENEKIINATYELHGKIINLMLTVNNEISVSNAKEIANSTISLFSNNELSFYSLQVYILKEDESLNNFPIIGYKGVESKELVFTNDREITVSEENQDEK